MPEKFKFTQKRIEELPLPEKGRKDYYDTDINKLACRVSSTGNKSFSITKRLTSGKLQRVTLGKYPDMTVNEARIQATESISSIARGINLNEEKQKKRYKAITLQELLETYLKDKPNLRKATITDYTKKLNQGFSGWLDKPINEINRDMVKTKFNSFTGGKDNKMRVLRLLMSYAHKTLEAIETNPVDIITNGKLWSKPKRKKRHIQSGDLKSWYTSVLNLENEKAKVYLLLLIHTGLRDKDIRYLEWKNIDSKNNSFIAKNTKNHSDFTVYPPSQLQPYLKKLHHLTGNSKFVFPGKSKDGVIGIPRKQIIQVCNQSNITFSSHDLKRTFLTIGEACMIPFSLLQKLANHVTDNDVTGGYLNTEAETLRTATQTIADYIYLHADFDSSNIPPL